ncbi:peptidoglycan DD-metalloendopeptidase family protein [Streptomyces sp. BA2]|uniref:aggregation-promoting factor C-terminal-like domain-containing protein n=1 Tax=Streptomyces sp. BA2 TaxID=436595 RepID=UPI00132AF721|nr:peptidoglycan DD-metalloendopeptidase family protein [Streptomyces sp. BA2]
MAIQVGSVEVDVIPNTRQIYSRLRAGLVPAATRAGEDAGNAAGRSFGPAMQAQVGNVGLAIGEQIGQQIAARITASLRDAIRDGVTQGGRTARPSAVRQGDDTAGAFSRAMKTHLQAAFRSLPKLQIGADTSEADSDLQALRFRMETLADKRIGIDISAADAKAEIRAIEAELTRLGAKHPNVQVRADTAAALTQLATVRAAIAAVDGKRINIRTDVSTAQATAALFQLTVALGAVAAIPAIPILAAGIGSIASAAVAAGAGVGALVAVAIPAFVGIAGALQAQKTAQDAAATASIKGGQAAGQGVSKAVQLAGAQQSLATAHRNAAQQISQAQRAVADAVESGAQRVRQAQEGVKDAVRSAAEANRSAAQQVKAAQQSVADAVQQAADRQRDAAERVAQAEDSLADAQRTARQAQQDLTQARKDAVLELAELSTRLAGAQLSERDAVLSVQEARDRLRATQAVGSKATLLQQQRAQLAYDQAVQRLKEQKDETKNLAAEKKAADKAGVEGSDTVKSAQERLAGAQRNVGDQQTALAKAHQEAAQQQIQGTRDIAAAQAKVSEAQRNAARTQEDGARSVARAQREVTQAAKESAEGVSRAQEQLAQARMSAADSIASAERQIASASQQAAGGVDQAAVAQAKYQEALAKLTPSARATFDAFVSLKGAFGDWSKSLQPQVMPIFTRALNGLKNSLPGLTPFVKAAADAIGELQDRASRGFKSEGWKEFKTDLAGAVRPAIIGMGIAFGNLFKGMGGIVQAFLPHMDSISARMQGITARFATWGTSLKGSPAFERFLAYSAEQGPIMARALGDISSAFYQVARALAPLSGPILEILGSLARGLASIAETLPWLIQGMYLVYVATKLWTIAMFLFNLVMKANPLVLLGLAIVALVGFVIYAYRHFDWFRNGVQAAWSGIQTAAMAAWNGFLKPAFDMIVAGAQTVGRWATWLWRVAIKPAFDGISLSARVLATVIVTLLVAPVVIAFRLAAATGTWLWKVAIGPAFRGIGALGKWLYEKALKPAFDGIGAAGRWLYRTALKPAFDGIAASGRWLYRVAIKPAADGIVASFRFVGKIGSWLYRTAIRPAFRGIGDVGRWLYRSAIKPSFDAIASRASWLYNKALKPAFSKIKEAVRLVGRAFDTARKAIGTAFGKIKSIVSEPVNFVIKYVYTKGIKAVWDKVAKFVGLDKLPDAPKLLEAGGTVGNGFGPARPMVTNRPTAIVGEGNPRYPEFVIPTDPKYRSRAQALHAAAGTRLMAKGGILGPLDGAWDWTKDTVSDVVGTGIDWAKAGADLLTNPSKIWTKLVKPIVGKIAKGVGVAGKWGSMIGKFPLKMITGLKDKIVSAVSSMFAGGGGGGEWAKPVNAKYGTRFGKKGSMWSSGYHTGLDFPAPTGTTIRAVNDGTISQVASGGPYGKHVAINHGGGLSSFYAHMSSMVAKMHKHIGRGKPIGKVGSTGNTTGPHLHLEARRNGKAVDPMPFLTGGGGGNAQATGAAQQYAKSILGRYGWGPSQFGPLKKLWNGESGWRWNALNRSSGAYGIPQCVDISTEILTRRGWLRYDEVRVGDETIGYNLATGKSEWTSITDVHHGAGELRRFGTEKWSANSTPNHRWLVERTEPLCEVADLGDIPAGLCQCGCGEATTLAKNSNPAKGVVRGRPNLYVHGHHTRGRRRDPAAADEFFVQQQDLKRRQRIVLARPAETTSGLDITVQEAALLAWVAGDGWQVKPRPSRGVNAEKGYKSGSRPMTYHIGQTKELNWAAIDAAVDGHGRVCRTRERHVNGELRRDREWRLAAPYARDLTERAGNPKTECVEQVLAMSTEQREAWLNAIIKAEGHVSAAHGERKPVTQISQKAGPLADAIVLAVYLSGQRPSVYVSTRTGGRRGTVPVWTITLTSPHLGEPRKVVGGKEVWKDESMGVQPVWCVTTELGTWTARQEENVFLTGNSLPASKMRSAGADYRTNAKTQIRWGLNYIKKRPDYGSPARAYSKWQSRSPHWYDQGGYLQPGLNLAYNGTGRPEPVFTGTQANALTRLATSPSGGGGGQFEGDLYLDSGAFLGHVRGEVQQTMTDLTNTLTAGRR